MWCIDRLFEFLCFLLLHYGVVAFVSQNMEETAERKGMWYYCQVKLGFNECLYCGDWCSMTILAIEWVIMLSFFKSFPPYCWGNAVSWRVFNAASAGWCGQLLLLKWVNVKTSGRSLGSHSLWIRACIENLENGWLFWIHCNFPLNIFRF